MQPFLVGLKHSIKQKLIFQELQDQGRIAPRVKYLSLYEAAASGLKNHPLADICNSPFWALSSKICNAKGNKTKRSSKKSNGKHIEEIYNGRTLIKRSHFWNGQLFNDVTHLPNNQKLFTYFVDGTAFAQELFDDKGFRSGWSAINNKQFFAHHNFYRHFMKSVPLDDSISFVDGITLSFLLRDIAAPKVLFLHADHRSPDGVTNPRARRLIEDFECDLIVTATERHRKLLYRDLDIQRPIAVLPHFVRRPPGPRPKQQARRDICTVSRLDLDGKPIGESIRAFDLIKDQLPGVNYLIYGSGSGEKKLADLIKTLGCGDRVKLKGYTPKPMTIFGKSLLSVYPTLTEGFGLAILESLIKGCPCITYDVDFGPRELIKAGQNGELITPGDVEDLSRKMLSVVQNNAAYCDQASKGLEKYSYAAHAENYATTVVACDILYRLKRDKAAVLGTTKSDTRKLRALFGSVPDTALQNDKLSAIYARLLTSLGEKEPLLDMMVKRHEAKPYSHKTLKRMILLSHDLQRHDIIPDLQDELKTKYPNQYMVFMRKNPTLQHLRP